MLLDTVNSNALITQQLQDFDSPVKSLCGQFHSLNESPLSHFYSDIQWLPSSNIKCFLQTLKKDAMSKCGTLMLVRLIKKKKEKALYSICCSHMAHFCVQEVFRFQFHLRTFALDVSSAWSSLSPPLAEVSAQTSPSQVSLPAHHI